MTAWARVLRLLPLLGAVLALGGCLPTPQSQSEEELEAHFQAGKARIKTSDFKGAIESFHRALEVNPQSASAHFELGWLYDQKETDPAAAIYHYNQYLKLRPKAGNAEMVRYRVVACKQELAGDVALTPVTTTLQNEIRKMAEQNRHLREELDSWRNYALFLQTKTNPPPAPAAPGPSGGGTAPQTPRASPAPPLESGPSNAPGGPSSRPKAPSQSATTRYHRVQTRETMSTIARKYGVKLEDLQRANPRLDSSRLRVGQEVVIPAK